MVSIEVMYSSLPEWVPAPAFWEERWWELRLPLPFDIG